jgi:hypothetical protein
MLTAQGASAVFLPGISGLGAAVRVRRAPARDSVTVFTVLTLKNRRSCLYNSRNE